jgi:hypothetical protein
MVVIHLCVKLSVFAVSMAMAGILKFPCLKTIYTHAIQHLYYVSFIKWPPNTKILRFGRNLVSKYIMMLRIDVHHWFAMMHGIG